MNGAQHIWTSNSLMKGCNLFVGMILLCLPLFSCAQDTTSETARLHGKWDYHFYTESGKGGYRGEQNYSLSLAELAKFKRKIDSVVGFLHEDPVVKDPLGFEPTVQSSIWTDAYAINYNTAVLKDKIPQAEIILQFCPLYKNAKTGKISKGCIEVSHFDVILNNINRSANLHPHPSSGGNNKASDNFNQIFQAPRVLKNIAPGVTAYENGLVVIANPEKPYWIPVSVGEYFDLDIKYNEEIAAEEGNTYVLDFVKKDLSHFSTEDLKKPAYVGCPTQECLTLVTTQESDKRWMRINPDYFDRSLPRTAVQLITINTLPEVFVSKLGEYRNSDYVYHFLFAQQLNFGKMRQLLDIPNK